MSLNKIDIYSLASLCHLCVSDVLKNRYFSSLFENQNELEFCILTELDILKNFLISSSNDKEHYVSLGYKYCQHNISLATIGEIVNCLQDKLVEQYGITEDMHQIVELYEISLDFETQGYFYASFDSF